MKLLKWLAIADRFTKAYLDERLAPLGINSSQHIYLLKLCERPGITQDALLESVYVHPSNVVRTVALLEKKGLLTREPCEHDKRTWQLYPTERAQAIYAQIRAACDETEAALLECVSAQAQCDFKKALLEAGMGMALRQGIRRTEDEYDD